MGTLRDGTGMLMLKVHPSMDMRQGHQDRMVVATTVEGASLHQELI